MVRAWLAWTLAAALCANSAQADGSSEKFFQQGNELLRTHRYAEAVERYRAALARDNSAKALLNLSIALHQLERNVEAAEALAEYLEHPGMNPDKAEFARALLDTVNARIGTVSIEVQATGAEISIDGRSVGKAPLAEPVRLDAGSHVVRAQSARGSASERVELAAGEHRRVVLAIHTQPPEPAREKRTLPPPVRNVPRTAPPSRASGMHAQRVWAVIVGSAGLAGLGIGGAFVLDARSRWNDAQERCPNDLCPRASDVKLEDDARRSARVATVSTVIGGTALLTGAVLWLTAPSASSSRSPRVSAAVLPGGASLVLVRSFE